MRYIANSNGYLQQVSFGADIVCNNRACTEYTGAVPSGYASLDDWCCREAEKLYRWKIANGQLTLDASAEAPIENDFPSVGEIPVATTDTVGVVKIGEDLQISGDGTLSVMTTDEVAQDNTRPVSSAAVNALIEDVRNSVGSTQEAIVDVADHFDGVQQRLETEMGLIDERVDILQTELLGYAPEYHASPNTTCGKGSSSDYGHVKLSASTSSTSGVGDGIAATPSAVKSAYDLANGASQGVEAVRQRMETEIGLIDERVDILQTAFSGCAPENHASSNTAYGKGDGSNYGHVKLSTSTSSTSGAGDGIAATPSAVKSAYDLANGASQGVEAVRQRMETEIGLIDERVDILETAFSSSTLCLIESADYPGCFYRTADGATEWLNPPMVVGVEYRTMEKWNGKAVYTVNISLGKSAATAATIDTSYAATSIIRTGGAMGRFGNPFIMHAATAYSVWAIAQISSGKIRCYLGSGASATGLDCYIHVWYTKD